MRTASPLDVAANYIASSPTRLYTLILAIILVAGAVGGMN
jgi:hypothetical protein